MGGEVIKKGGAGTDKDDIVGWKRATDKVVIKKALFCLTEDDVWFIFPNCQIVAREANTDKAIAIALMGGEVIKKGGAGTDKDDIVGWKRATDKVVIKKQIKFYTESLGMTLLSNNSQEAILGTEDNTPLLYLNK